MSDNETPHDEMHEALIHRLVEKSLIGEERRAVERRLLSCPACLAEYNWYSEWWEGLTHPDYLERCATYLQAHDTQKYNLYQQALRKLSEPMTPAGGVAAAQAGWWSSVILWRNVALTLAAIILLALPLGVYRWWALEQANRQRTGAEDRLRKPLSQEPARAQELSKTVDDLSKEVQRQAGIIAELSQRLDLYAQPSLNAIIEDAVFNRRVSGEDKVQEIKLPKDKRFLRIVIQSPEGMPDARYKLSFMDSRGAEVWQSHPIRKGSYDSFDVLIAKDFFKERDYVLKISSIQGPQKVFTFPFRIVTEP